ncbi:tail fiber protein [Pectobacterium araliae]|uniref:tail fiber protein n=1 Tax=Pectobacterium araliae TaxID=3073862 RepID=UPI0021C4465D
MKTTNKKGFSLLEITLVLGIGTAMAFMKFQDMKKDQENIIANTVGAQMKQMGEAVNRYISIRYDKLSTLSSSSSQTSDPGPRACSANGCEITYQTLVNEGLLPAGHTGVNMQKSSYKILLKRAGTTPNYVINGLVVTTLPWSEGNRIRYDLLGRAMQAAGIDSGMTQSASVASGTGGQWTEASADYNAINKAGLLAYRVGYDSAMYSVYLRRDGTLPMTGDLNMGGQSINNAKNITASGVIQTTTLTASGNISSDGTVSGQYLKPTSTVVLGAACESTGLISKDANGMMLICRAGVWKSISDFPVGSPIPWPTATPPIGWLVCNGQAFNKSAYPSLAKAYPTGFLPDLRGVFIRGWDNGRGLDDNRALLSYQEGQSEGSVVPNYGGYLKGHHSGMTYYVPASSMGLETRPKNVAFNYIVKAE